MTCHSNRRVLLAKEKFSGTTVCIPYGLDVKGLSAGETVDAVITINSNLGEYQCRYTQRSQTTGFRHPAEQWIIWKHLSNWRRVIIGRHFVFIQARASESAAGRRSGIRKPVPGDVQKPGDLSAYGRVSDRNRKKKSR